MRAYRASGGKFAWNTFISRFGSWNKALAQAGVSVSSRKNISDEELFANLESVWRHLGRQPRFHQFCKPLSSYPAGSYARRFGSWRKALEAFISFINESDKDGEVSRKEFASISASDATQVSARGSRHINWRMRFLVMRRDDFKCRYCGRSPANNPGLELHIDHVQAYSKDGPATMENLRTACNVCNIGKSNLDAVELAQVCLKPSA